MSPPGGRNAVGGGEGGVGLTQHGWFVLEQSAIFSTGRSHPHVQVCVCGEAAAAAGEHVNAVM